MDLVRRFQDVAAAEVAWDDLADRVTAAPFLRPGWVRAWLDAFGPRGGVRVYTAWRDGRLTALAPLLQRRGVVRYPANEHTPFAGLLAEDEAAARAVVADILADRPRAVHVTYLDTDAPASTVLIDMLDARGYRAMVHDHMKSPFTDVGRPWDEIEKRLSRSARKDLRRSDRRLHEYGDVDVEVQDGSSELTALLAEGFRVEAAGWKGAQGTAIVSDPATHRFYTSVATWAAARDLLRLAFVRVDGRPIAFELLLTDGQAIYDVKGGYDEHFSKGSPSMFLVRHILEAATSGPTSAFEWLGHDEPYKLRWSDGVRERMTATWFAPTLAGTVDRGLRQTWRTASAALREQAAARMSDETVQRLKELRGALRSRLRSPGSGP